MNSSQRQNDWQRNLESNEENSMVITQISKIEDEYYVYLSNGVVVSVGATPPSLAVGDRVRLILSRDDASDELAVHEGNVGSAASDVDSFVRPSDGKSGWHI